MTTPKALWVAFGNPTKNTWRFFECFNKYRHRWITREIDSRTCKKANKAQIAKWAEDYGEEELMEALRRARALRSFDSDEYIGPNTQQFTGGIPMDVNPYMSQFVLGNPDFQIGTHDLAYMSQKDIEGMGSMMQRHAAAGAPQNANESIMRANLRGADHSWQWPVDSMMQARQKGIAMGYTDPIKDEMQSPGWQKAMNTYNAFAGGYR